MTQRTLATRYVTPDELRAAIAAVEASVGYATPAEVLAALLTVDGAGSGLDADLLDGLTSAAFATAAQGATADAAVPKALFDANTILAATTDNTPAALTVAASRIVGRKASGDIAAMTGAETTDLLRASSATETGVVELATSAETITGTDTVRAVTPAGLAAKVSSTTAQGIVELATSAETITGSDTDRAVTPAGLHAKTASATAIGLVELATDAETTTGTDTTRATTPANVAAAITARTASSTAQGIVELATDAEAETGTDTARALTPANASATYVKKSLYDANTILAATSDNTPAALTVGASTVVGRKASGGIAAMTGAETTALLSAASDTASGVVELATNAETVTGTDAVRAVTPAGLAAKTASATAQGIVELATDAEAETGTDTARALTPANGAATYVKRSLYDANTILAATTDNTPVALTVAASRIVGRKASGDIAAMTGAETTALLSAASDTASGVVELATTAEAITGTDTVRAVTPAGVAAAMGAAVGISATIVDAKGDLIAATAADTVARLAVGANDTILVADSSQASGLRWNALTWTAVSGGIGFSNSWVDFGGTVQTVQYRKIGDVVYLRGSMKNGTLGATAFTLPAGFRPPAQIAPPCQCNGAFGYAVISSAGVVTPVSPTGTNANFNFDITFSITA